MLLKRNPSLTEQAKAFIKEKILDDEFENGRIPSETELAEMLGISRTTVRDALSRLEQERVIYRKQGAGTFVNKAGLQIKSRLDEIWSYTAMLEAHGYTPAVQLLSAELEKADRATAVALDLTPTAEVLVVRKLYLEDEKPVIFTRNYIPTALLNEEYEQDDLCQPVYEFLANNGRSTLNYYLSELVPLNASKKLAELLNVPPKTALISMEEIGYNMENQPILKSISCFRDDLLRLRLIRKQTL